MQATFGFQDVRPESSTKCPAEGDPNEFQNALASGVAAKAATVRLMTNRRTRKAQRGTQGRARWRCSARYGSPRMNEVYAFQGIIRPFLVVEQ